VTRHDGQFALALSLGGAAERDVQRRRFPGDVAPLVPARQPVPVREQELERHAGVHLAPVEEVTPAAGVGGLDELRVRLVPEQRVEVLGAPVIPARVVGCFELGGPRVPRRAVRDAALVARGVGRSGWHWMFAFGAPAAPADRLVGDCIGIAAAMGRA
jgi:hypothetical protein